MITYTHIIVNSALLNRKDEKTQRVNRGLFWSCIIAALLPDLPMVIFFIVDGVILKFPQNVLWFERYYLEYWQVFFNIFNSAVFASVIILLGYVFKKTVLTVFGSSLMLHFLFDFFLHHNDGHAHFFPLSDFVFKSPVSYWDVQYYGAYASIAETIVLVICSIVFFRQRTSVRGRVACLSFFGVSFLGQIMHFLYIVGELVS